MTGLQTAAVTALTFASGGMAIISEDTGVSVSIYIIGTTVLTGGAWRIATLLQKIRDQLDHLEFRNARMEVRMEDLERRMNE